MSYLRRDPPYNCPIILARSSVKVLDFTGFNIYNASSDVANYVIEPDKKGTITFTITRGGPPKIIGSPDTNPNFHIPEKQAYANNAIFMHQENITVEQNITS
jgi:hypothetical protein